MHNEITRELSLSKNMVPGPADSKASVLVQRSVYPPPANIADSLFGGGTEEVARSIAELVLNPEKTDLVAVSPERRLLFTPEAGSSGSALPYTHSHTHPRAPGASRPDDVSISSLPNAHAAAATFFVSSTPTLPSGEHTHTAQTHTPAQTELPHTPASVEFGAFVGEYDEDKEEDSGEKEMPCLYPSVSVLSEKEEHQDEDDEGRLKGAASLFPSVVVCERESYVNLAFTDDGDHDEGSVESRRAPAFSTRKPQRGTLHPRCSQTCEAALQRLRARNGTRGLPSA